MNLLLLDDRDFDSEDTVSLTDDRARHAREVLRIQAGDELRVGRRGGLVGSAEVLSNERDAVRLRVKLDAAPPPRPGIDLILAMPRPKALKRLLPAIASMGIDHLVLLRAARVEKSYFDAQALEHSTVARLFDLGLEQARDTIRPTLTIERRFRPYIEDRLPTFAAGATCLVAHPEPPSWDGVNLLTFGGDGSGDASGNGNGNGDTDRLVLAVGPEGGWVPFELELLRAAGFSAISLGVRPLRTEVAIPALIGATGRLGRG